MKTSDIKRLGEAYQAVLESSKEESKAQFVAAARAAKKEGKKEFMFAGKKFPVTAKEVEEAEKSLKASKLDPVDDKANDKKFKDRKDKDIDNDGDVDDSDEYLHNRRAKVDDEIDGGKKPAKNAKKESVEVDEARQMKDPKKDSMVSKGGKTIVIDKSKEKEYLKKGWTLAEEDEGEEEEPKKKEVKKPVPAKDVKKDEEEKGDDISDEEEDGDGETEAEKDEDEAEEKPADKKKDDKKKEGNPHTSDKTPEISKIETVKKESYSSQFEEMWAAVAELNEKRKESQGATEPEAIDSKESKGSKEFAAKHKVEKKKPEDVGEKPFKEQRSLVDMARDVLAGKQSFDEMKGQIDATGDEPTGDEPKGDKKKNPFDGRTTEAKKFLERMSKRRG